MKARLLAMLLTAPLLAAPLTGCNGAVSPLSPSDILTGVSSGPGAPIATAPALTITTFTSDPSKTELAAGEQVRLSVETNRSGAVYSWGATGGTLTAGRGNTATWVAPEKPGVYTVDVTAREGGESAPGSFRFTVK